MACRRLGDGERRMASETVTLTEERVETVQLIANSSQSIEPKKKVMWTNDVVDNEHLGRKSSKSMFSPSTASTLRSR
jgi:Protein phosphatase inhibitor